jgi:hypothetical protein
MNKKTTLNTTRYQILFLASGRRNENFTAAQKKRFDARCAQLTKQGVVFTKWDTRNNALSRSFFGGI